MSSNGDFSEASLVKEGVETQSFEINSFKRYDRKLVTKIDLHILPVVIVLYLCAFIDRSVLSKHFPLLVDRTKMRPE